MAALAAKLGEVYWADEGSIGHNSITTIVGRDGRIAARVDGSQWRIEQVQNLIAWVESLKRDLEIPGSIRDARVN